MLYREIIAVCSEIHTKHINTAVWAERGINMTFPPIHKNCRAQCGVQMNFVLHPSLQSMNTVFHKILAQ